MDPTIIASSLLTERIIDLFFELRKFRREEDLDSDKWNALENAYLEHLKWRFEYPAGVFRQQAITGWAISSLVVILIVSGLVFSFLQLRYAMTIGDLSSLETEMAVETAGRVSVGSSIVGAVVLVISLGFFYLYLRHVFRIQYPRPPHVGLSETDILTLLKDRPHLASSSLSELIGASERQRDEAECEPAEQTRQA